MQMYFFIFVKWGGYEEGDFMGCISLSESG